ncbi:hypothetical protein TI39_contig4339g00009 [Zymoseptoria brevis]|uniref:Uncharacterized protein n=1 Tax=Zymoseptoria brevis TaxID=1047168 RepID=A0A0F4G8G4_9PEZI|nr:hypothetical protein TI39_contig4339g00009 [Zymoseptoria brevis]
MHFKVASLLAVAASALTCDSTTNVWHIEEFATICSTPFVPCSYSFGVTSAGSSDLPAFRAQCSDPSRAVYDPTFLACKITSSGQDVEAVKAFVLLDEPDKDDRQGLVWLWVDLDFKDGSGKAQTWHADKKGAFFEITDGPKDFDLAPVAGKGNPPTYA